MAFQRIDSYYFFNYRIVILTDLDYSIHLLEGILEKVFAKFEVN